MQGLRDRKRLLEVWECTASGCATTMAVIAVMCPTAPKTTALETLCKFASMTTFISHIHDPMNPEDAADFFDEIGVTPADCVALRFHAPDGSVKDIVWGGTCEERQTAMVVLQAGQDQILP